ncbi:MAG: hypothetical protein ABGX27_07475, partial [Desulfurobacteriaceae bacterium]
MLSTLFLVIDLIALIAGVVLLRRWKLKIEKKGSVKALVFPAVVVLLFFLGLFFNDIIILLV